MSPIFFRLLLLLAGLGVSRTGTPAALPPGAARALPVTAIADSFPHERHARLFPVCDGCHAGIIESGAPDFPDPAACARCHDGTRTRRVAWTEPARRATNLRFSHAGHRLASERAGKPAECHACHLPEGGGRMAVTQPRPEHCFTCHVDAGHLDAPAGCALCHAPLAQVTAWDTSRIAALPRPMSHTADGFLHSHGAAANASGEACTTCHARESCQRCHPNAGQLPVITALANDPRVAALVRGRAPRYDAPASHNDRWAWSHGAAAAAAATCANCHARPSCTACHLTDNQATRALSVPGDTAGTGATTVRVETAGPGVRYASTPRVHGRDWVRSHQAAGASETTCLGCHERKACAQCHAALRAGGFHEPNFVEQHGPAAYASDVQCSSCHSTERFCRGCHAGTGRAGEGRNNVAFHSAAPLWLLGHGQAARQSLEGCASCHAQADCTRCHSALSGWRVNPHGSGFNANRLAGANRLTCLRCHRAAELGVR